MSELSPGSSIECRWVAPLPLLPILLKIIFFFLAGFSGWRVFTYKTMSLSTCVLLADFVRTGSEAAFRELVSRYTVLSLLNSHSTA